MNEMQALYPPWVDGLDPATRLAVKGELDRYAAVRSALGERRVPERPDALIGMALRAHPHKAVRVLPPKSVEDKVVETLIKDALTAAGREMDKARIAAQSIEEASPGSPLAQAAASASGAAEGAFSAIKALNEGAIDDQIHAALAGVTKAIGLSRHAAEAIKVFKNKLPTEEPARYRVEAAENALQDAGGHFNSAERYLQYAAEPSNGQARTLLMAQAAEKILYAARESGQGPRLLLQFGGQPTACLTDASQSHS